MNIDTDLQYAYMTGVRDYFSEKGSYLQAQIGNPDGDDVLTKNIMTQEFGLERQRPHL